MMARACAGGPCFGVCIGLFCAVIMIGVFNHTSGKSLRVESLALNFGQLLREQEALRKRDDLTPALRSLRARLQKGSLLLYDHMVDQAPQDPAGVIKPQRPKMWAAKAMMDQKPAPSTLYKAPPIAVESVEKSARHTATSGTSRMHKVATGPAEKQTAPALAKVWAGKAIVDAKPKRGTMAYKQPMIDAVPQKAAGATNHVPDKSSTSGVTQPNSEAVVNNISPAASSKQQAKLTVDDVPDGVKVPSKVRLLANAKVMVDKVPKNKEIGMGYERTGVINGGKGTSAWFAAVGTTRYEGQKVASNHPIESSMHSAGANGGESSGRAAAQAEARLAASNQIAVANLKALFDRHKRTEKSAVQPQAQLASVPAAPGASVVLHAAKQMANQLVAATDDKPHDPTDLGIKLTSAQRASLVAQSHMDPLNYGDHSTTSTNRMAMIDQRPAIMPAVPALHSKLASALKSAAGKNLHASPEYGVQFDSNRPLTQRERMYGRNMQLKKLRKESLLNGTSDDLLSYIDHTNHTSSADLSAAPAVTPGSKTSQRVDHSGGKNAEFGIQFDPARPPTQRELMYGRNKVYTNGRPLAT